MPWPTLGHRSFGIRDDLSRARERLWADRTANAAFVALNDAPSRLQGSNREWTRRERTRKRHAAPSEPLGGSRCGCCPEQCRARCGTRCGSSAASPTSACGSVSTERVMESRDGEIVSSSPFRARRPPVPARISAKELNRGRASDANRLGPTRSRPEAHLGESIQAQRGPIISQKRDS